MSEAGKHSPAPASAEMKTGAVTTVTSCCCFFLIIVEMD
jgi:hypothetical protein